MQRGVIRDQYLAAALKQVAYEAPHPLLGRYAGPNLVAGAT
jgi:hypothetical protein